MLQLSADVLPRHYHGQPCAQHMETQWGLGLLVSVVHASLLVMIATITFFKCFLAARAEFYCTVSWDPLFAH